MMLMWQGKRRPRARARDFNRSGFDVRVLTIPQGKYPDEFVRSNGKEAFLKLINSATPLNRLRLKRAEEGIDFKTANLLFYMLKELRKY